MEYGLIGNPLGHSYSKPIHNALRPYDYEIHPLLPECVKEFMETADFKGINVTIPYKQTVIPFCETVSPQALDIGSVNTIVKDAQGKLHGYNTDYKGFLYMAKRAGISMQGKNVFILGSGGTSLTARAAAKDEGAQTITVVSREGEICYDNIYDWCINAEIIINTTPVGMFPNVDASPVDLKMFPNCQGVIDVIYNPLCTRLLQQAQDLGIPCTNGLPMLVAQAKYAGDLFTGEPIDDSAIESVLKEMEQQFANYIFIGMPGSGKTTVAKILHKALNLPLVDTDKEIEKEAGMPIPEIFEKFGEQHFRDLESEIIARFCGQPGILLSVGGGAVLREQNRKSMRQNGTIFWVKRPLDALATNGRPLSKSMDALQEMEKIRTPLYAGLADCVIENIGRPQEAADVALAKIKGE